MRIYWEILKRSFQRHLTYRAATLAGLLTNFAFGIIRVAVFVALYGSQQEVAGITLKGAITYTGLSQAVIGYLSMFHWYELMQSVYTGEVGSDLIKPINFFTFWMSKDLGRATVTFLLRGVTFMIMFELAFDLIHPQDFQQWIGLSIAIIFSWFVSFSWRFIVNLAAFWTPNAIGIGRLAFVLSWFFSGFLMPLRYFPEWVEKISFLTPFPHTVNTVVEIYLGLLRGQDLIQALLLQIIWAFTLILIGQIIFRIGVRRLVILGG